MLTLSTFSRSSGQITKSWDLPELTKLLNLPKVLQNIAAATPEALDVDLEKTRTEVNLWEKGLRAQTQKTGHMLAMQPDDSKIRVPIIIHLMLAELPGMLRLALSDASRVIKEASGQLSSQSRGLASTALLNFNVVCKKVDQIIRDASTLPPRLEQLLVQAIRGLRTQNK